MFVIVVLQVSSDHVLDASTIPSDNLYSSMPVYTEMFYKVVNKNKFCWGVPSMKNWALHHTTKITSILGNITFVL